MSKEAKHIVDGKVNFICSDPSNSGGGGRRRWLIFGARAVDGLFRRCLVGGKCRGVFFSQMGLNEEAKKGVGSAYRILAGVPF
jgi:hypothetical protein